MYFLNSLLGSFFRTIGRILAYLLIGMAIMLVINEVKAETYEPISIRNWGSTIEYIGTCDGMLCELDIDEFVFGNTYGSQYNVYFGEVEHIENSVYYAKGSFYGYVYSFEDDEFYDNHNIGLKVWMSDLQSYVQNLSCETSANNNGIFTTIDFLCSWEATQAHTYEIEIQSRITYEPFSNSVFVFNGVITNDKDVNTTIENSTSQIIINQNQNSQNIINNQNSNQQQTNQGLENIDNTNKSILQTIIDLPKNIINGFIDMLKSLFIPSDNFFTDKFNEVRENAESKLGILGYPFVLVIDTLEYFLTIEDTGEYIITWNDVNVPNFEEYAIIKGGSFDLSSLLEKDIFKTAHDLYMVFVNSILVLLFINLCRKKYNSVFGGGE